MKKFSKRINEDNSIQMYKYSMSVDVEGSVLSTSEGDAGEIIDQIVDEIGGVNDTIKVTNYEINTIDVVENDNNYSEIEESNKSVVIKENNSILNNLDMDVNQHLMSITSNGKNMGNVGIKDGKIVTDGFIGYNEYTNFVNLIHGLQGHGIAIDDFYF